MASVARCVYSVSLTSGRPNGHCTHSAAPDKKQAVPAIKAPLAVEQWPVERPVAYARNPRRNEAAVAKVKASLAEYGWRQPIVVDGKGVIVAGHTRLLAARELGMATVLVHVATDLTPTQVKAYRIADNRVAQEATWDTELLAFEMTDLSTEGFDLALTGFDEGELDAMLGLAGAGPEPASDESVGADQWICVVTCGNETELAALYDRLNGEGYACKLVT